MLWGTTNYLPIHTVSRLFLFPNWCKSNVKNQIKNQELLGASWYFSKFSPRFLINRVIGGGCLLWACGKVALWRSTAHGSSFWGAPGRTTSRDRTDCRGLESYSLDLRHCTSKRIMGRSWNITRAFPSPPTWNYTFAYALSTKILISMPSSYFNAVRVQLILIRFSFVTQSVNPIYCSFLICFLLSSISLGS